MQTFRLLVGILFLFTSQTKSFALHPFPEEEGGDRHVTSLLRSTEKSNAFHEDSIHQLNLRYADNQKGLKPWIAPAVLVTSGTVTHFMSGFNKDFRDFMQENFAYTGSLDDYGQYSPLAAVYLLNLAGVKGKNNFGNRSAIAFKSILLSSTLTYRLKVWVNETRPDGDLHSFPSGHTSTAFTFAQFMHREYGDRSHWYSIGAYSVAATVGIMRMAKNVHWVPDVLMGAGIGILSTELVYLTHQYKWDSEHLKRLDIFPFQIGKQKGLSLVYTF
jgi:membrane-associated phospholipid phosphatase